ncbi:hypothetical protein DLJ53_19255 [Acuticoccus sediminis]|uniref:Cysteine rich repeat protein n=2 Tax=Acuticoccus sediminis TaxID=2184697 RepID=A0A8B2NRY9_9HYPH|nr:hypothetical protein DLJ53_19255 [Acuticoccus sediminis]
MRTILAALTLSVLAVSGAANAQTMGYADAIAMLSKQCGGDISKYCSKAVLANFEITDCLVKNQSKLSGSCQGSLVTAVQNIQARTAAQQAAGEVCKTDAARLCKLTVPGQGHILRCLLKAEPSVSAKCNAAITNAGWR